MLIDRCVGCRPTLRLVGGPAGEEGELFGGSAVGLGGVGDDHESVAGEFEGVAGEVDVADDRVVEGLVGGAVGAYVVACPAGGELVAAGGELADEVGQGPADGVAADLAAQAGDDVVGDGRPVTEEVRSRGDPGRRTGRGSVGAGRR